MTRLQAQILHGSLLRSCLTAQCLANIGDPKRRDIKRLGHQRYCWLSTESLVLLRKCDGTLGCTLGVLSPRNISEVIMLTIALAILQAPVLRAGGRMPRKENVYPMHVAELGFFGGDVTQMHLLKTRKNWNPAGRLTARRTVRPILGKVALPHSWNGVNLQLLQC